MAAKRPVASRGDSNAEPDAPSGSEAIAEADASEAVRQTQGNAADVEPLASSNDLEPALKPGAAEDSKAERARRQARQRAAQRRKEQREEEDRLLREQDEANKLRIEEEREEQKLWEEEQKREEDLRFEDYLQRQILRSWIILIFGVAAVFAGLSVVVAFLDLGLPDRGRIAGIVIPGIICGILIACGLSIPRMRRARFVLRAREEEAKQKAKQATEELSDATDLSQQLRANRKQIEAYDELARLQSREAFRNSQVAIFIGMIALIIGALVAILVPDTTAKVTTATLTAIGGMLAGYIGRTFLRVYERTQAQLTYFFQQPLINSYVLSAERLIDKHLTDKDTQVANVIDRILAVLVQLPESWSVWSAPDGANTGRRRRRTTSLETGGNAEPEADGVALSS